MRAFGSLQDWPTSRAERLGTMKMPILAGFTAGVIATGGTALAVANSDHGTKASGDSLSVTSVSAPKDVARSVYKSAKDSVVFVSSQTAEGTGTGSGVVVSSDGKIITKEHVVDGAQQVTVKIGTGGTPRTATVLAADASKDLALLKVDASGLKPLALGDSASVAVGETTYAIGNPYGLDHTFTSGIVSALGRSIQSPDGSPIDGAIQTDAAINPGNSGGALLDVDGGVIGVNSQIASANSSGGESGNVGIGFAIPSNTVKDFIAHPTSSTAQAQPEEQQSAPQDEQVLPDEQRQQDESPVDPYGLDQAPDDQSQGADPSYGYTPSPDGGYELVP